MLSSAKQILAEFSKTSEPGKTEMEERKMSREAKKVVYE